MTLRPGVERSHFFYLVISLVYTLVCVLIKVAHLGAMLRAAVIFVCFTSIGISIGTQVIGF